MISIIIIHYLSLQNYHVYIKIIAFLIFYFKNLPVINESVINFYL